MRRQAHSEIESTTAVLARRMLNTTEFHSQARQMAPGNNKPVDVQQEKAMGKFDTFSVLKVQQSRQEIYVVPFTGFAYTYLQYVLDQVLLLGNEALPVLFILFGCFVQHIGEHTNLS